MTSVAFASMEVAAGPAAAYVGVRGIFDRASARRGEGDVEGSRAESSESSSIGAGEESSLSLSSVSTAEDGRGCRGGGEEEEVQSELKQEGLSSLASLEECLPIKRGLSNCFAGKSKSFASLAEAAVLRTAEGLAKLENPFNKRRRILMACKASWQRRASYAALNTSSLRVLEEEEDEDEGGEMGDEGSDESPALPALPMAGRLANTFRSPRSFSLTDLQGCNMPNHL